MYERLKCTSTLIALIVVTGHWLVTAQAADPHAIYENRCAGCHAPHARGLAERIEYLGPLTRDINALQRLEKIDHSVERLGHLLRRPIACHRGDRPRESSGHSYTQYSPGLPDSLSRSPCRQSRKAMGFKSLPGEKPSMNSRNLSSSIR